MSEDVAMSTPPSHKRVRPRGERRHRKAESSSTTLPSIPAPPRSLEGLAGREEAADAQRKNGILLGLTIAGVGSSLLTTVFGVFHVDTFLKAYHLPLPTYSYGNFVFSIVNTANDVAGAWLVDHIAVSRQRTDLVGFSGLLYVLCFLTPFFRWWREPSSLDGTHFVVSLSLYDTLYSFTTILLGTFVTDNHHMSDTERVQFMASGKFVNLLASFCVTRVGLATFDANDLSSFHHFVLALAFVVALMFVVGQLAIAGIYNLHNSPSWRDIFRRSILLKPRYDVSSGDTTPFEIDYKKSDSMQKLVKGTMHWRRVLQDFLGHSNFRAWILMEMLLEAQMTFVSFFLKTFVDGLLFDGGVDRATCDWLIALSRPMRQLAVIGIYVPIKQFGYTPVYKVVFGVNMFVSTSVYLFCDISHTNIILAFLVVYPVMTGAIQSAGFHLAMSDMVTELKRDRLVAGRFGEPSLAGMFMGVNALVCKPMESLLPIVAATVLDKSDESEHGRRLLELLVVPPALCAVFQLWSWSSYDLSPSKSANMRRQLQEMELTVGETADLESSSGRESSGAFSKPERL